MSTSVVLIVTVLGACGSCAWNLDLVDYTPRAGADWEVSTPEAQGLDPMVVAALYFNGAKVETLHALLVVKNGYLVAERYFGEGSIDQETRIQSATKSYTSALVGVALDQGYLSSVDQKMMEFFPELAPRITDPRKNRITLRQMLQMRAGYPWEESSEELFELLYANGGQLEGSQVIPAEWVADSLDSYTEDAWYYRIGRNVADTGYGYQWWSARAGKRRYNFAWGHGGQQIAVLAEENLVVVKADPLYGQHGDAPWRHEKANLNLVGNFMASLPSD